MLSGTLRIRNNKYYVIIYWQEDGKQEQFHFFTGIKVNGKKEKEEATAILLEARLNFDPNNLVKMQEKYLKRKARKKIDYSNFKDSKVINLTVIDFFEWALNIYLRTKPDLSIVTINGYKQKLKKLKKYKPFESIKIQDLTKNDVNIYLEKLFYVEKLSSITVSGIRTFMRMIVDVAVEKEIMNFNLMDKTKHIKQKKIIKKTLSKEKALLFLNFIEKSEYDFEFFYLLLLGLRKSELLGLKMEDFNIEDKTISLSRSLIWDDEKKRYLINDNMKNFTSHRTLPLLTKLEELYYKRIERIKADKDFFGNSYSINEFKNYLCIDREGNILGKYKLNYELTKILKEIGLEHHTLHELRHTCATLLYKEGVDLKKIQHWLGHKNITTTANIYTHYDNTKDNEISRTIEEFFKK